MSQLIYHSKFHSLLTHIESRLAAYYGFNIQASAYQFLIDSKSLKNQLDEFSSSQDQHELNQKNGSVWICNDGDQGETWVGLNFSERVIEQMIQNDPLVNLNDENLDSLCVVVEEISHLHLILNRSEFNSGVTHAELEFQGEIDRVLMSLILFEDQKPFDCSKAILSNLLESSHWLLDESKESYVLADKWAAQFWSSWKNQSLSTDGFAKCDRLAKVLRKFYWATLAEKIHLSSNIDSELRKVV